uniref:Uncharacterized protein n=1 Tax=Strigamia maritima TaxID=126957 RepID=T1IVT6_STRMM
MAEQLLSIIEEKLDEGETDVWNEVPQVIRGAVTFRQWAPSGPPCPVIDVYLVLGGVYSSQGHYRIASSSTEIGAYDYIHRLSNYHLNPFTFRHMMEDALMKVLSALKHEEKIISSIKVDSTISVTPTNDALELTCCANGVRAPAWMLRFIPAIEGFGAAPHAVTPQPPKWLIVPPPRTRGPYVRTWDVASVSEPDRALVCAVYEAQCQNWGEGQIDLDRLFNRFADQVRSETPLEQRFEQILKRVVERVEQRHLEDEIPEDQIDRVVCQINRIVESEDLGSRVRSIDAAIERCFPWLLKQEAQTAVDEPARQPVVECISRKDTKPLLANGTTLVHREPKGQMGNGVTRHEAKGINKNRDIDDAKKKNKNKKDDERARKRFFGLVSICLVLVVVGLVFIVAWFEETDVINLMHGGKLLGVLSSERKEF